MKTKLSQASEEKLSADHLPRQNQRVCEASAALTIQSMLTATNRTFPRLAGVDAGAAAAFAGSAFALLLFAALELEAALSAAASESSCMPFSR